MFVQGGFRECWEIPTKKTWKTVCGELLAQCGNGGDGYLARIVMGDEGILSRNKIWRWCPHYGH
jgi:hypothetical protein